MLRITSKSRCAAVVTLSLATCLAADKPKEAFHNFNALEVEKFENPKFETKEPMPSAWVATIQEDIVQRVIELHKFRRIMDFEDSKAAPCRRCRCGGRSGMRRAGLGFRRANAR